MVMQRELSAIELEAMADAREWEDYLPGVREFRTAGSRTDLTKRDNDYDDLYAGRWQAVGISEMQGGIPPYIENGFQTASDDYARLVSSARPSVTVRPVVLDKDSKRKAQVVEAILGSHWAYNFFDEDVPQLAYDFVRGRAFVSVWWRPECPYPTFEVLDPRTCFPRWRGKQLVDLLTRTVRQRAEVADEYPGLLDGDPAKTEEVEVLDYYSRLWLVKVVCGIEGGSLQGRPHVAQATINKTGVVPVAAGRLHTGDRQMRGLIDQAKYPMLTRNTGVAYIVKHLRRTVMAPTVTFDVADGSVDGPDGEIKLLSPEGRFDRAAPQRIAPEAFKVLADLAEAVSGATGVAAQRGGQDLPSILSATGVNAVNGVENTNVEYLQQCVAALRRQICYIGLAVDRTYRDYEKPLLVPSTQETYTPSEDAMEFPHIEVTYGVGAGLDPYNRMTALFAAAGNRFISKEYGRSQLPGMTEAFDQGRQINMETMEEVILSQIAGVSPLSTKARFVELYDEERQDLVKVMKRLRDEGFVLDPSEFQQQALPPGPPAQQPTAEEQAYALEKGAAAQQGPVAGPGEVGTPEGDALVKSLVGQAGAAAFTQNISRPQ